MSPFPRAAYRPLSPYSPDRRPIEVDLSDNTNRWGPHPAALEAVRNADPTEVTRYPSVYADALRQAVANRFGVTASCVVTGCGSDDLLDSAFRAAGDPGEPIAFIPPTFSMIEIFARMNGMTALPVSAERAADPAVLLQGDPALIYVCRPNNPTGEAAPRAWVDGLLDEVGKDGPIVLLDEAYVDFADDDFLSEAAESSRLVVLRTLSKVYGMAGLRVGFAVGAPEVVQEIEKSRGPYKVNRLAERAALAAIEDAEGWVPRIVEEVQAQRERLQRELGTRGLAPLPSGANFLLVPLRADGPLAGREANDVTGDLRERGVAVRPFPALEGLGEAVRISIGPANETDRLLQALDEVLR